MNGKSRLRLWIKAERSKYAIPKWTNKHKVRQREIVDNGEWYNFLFSYLKRAEGATLKTEYGRQQLGKAIVAATDLLEAAIEEHGDMPRPGYPSGEIHSWASVAYAETEGGDR